MKCVMLNMWTKTDMYDVFVVSVVMNRILVIKVLILIVS